MSFSGPIDIRTVAWRLPPVTSRPLFISPNGSCVLIKHGLLSPLLSTWNSLSFETRSLSQYSPDWPETNSQLALNSRLPSWAQMEPVTLLRVCFVVSGNPVCHPVAVLFPTWLPLSLHSPPSVGQPSMLPSEFLLAGTKDAIGDAS